MLLLNRNKSKSKVGNEDMKKGLILLLQLLVLIFSTGCIVTSWIHSLVDQKYQEIGAVDQPLTDFEAWKKGYISVIPIDAGKDELPNYREHIMVEFTGVNETGAPVHYLQEYLVEDDKTQGAHREVETFISPDTYWNGTSEFVTMDEFNYNIQYQKESGPYCETNDYDPTLGKITIHNYIIQGFAPGKLLEENVEVNGGVADVFEIDSVPLFFKNEIKLTNGKVWISRGTPYFVKAEGTLEGDFWLDTAFSTGTAQFTYDVKDQGGVSIQIPSLCSNPPVNLFPIPSNATEIDKSPWFYLTFSSPDDRERIVAFYKEELESTGWNVEVETIDSYPLVMRAFTKTTDKFQIDMEMQINAMSDSSYVVIHWKVN